MWVLRDFSGKKKRITKGPKVLQPPMLENSMEASVIRTVSEKDSER